MKLPSHEECIELLREHNPENIVKHCLIVNRLSNYLAGRLKGNGIRIDLKLVDRASLLHDIGKFRSLGTKVFDGQIGYEMLMEKGLPEIAQIAKEHNLEGLLNPDFLKTWEAKVVFYADKRVEDSRIVPLKRRFDYIRRVYGSRSEEAMERINRAEKPAKELEKLICSNAGISPEELSDPHGAD